MRGSLRDSDVQIDKNIWVSTSCIYNRRLKHNARDVARVVYKALDKFRKHLDFPKDVAVRVCPIKGNTNGRYFDGTRLVEIDCSLSWSRALEVLAHELVHAEQYHQGRLKKMYSMNKGWIHAWHGSKNYSKGSTYQAYRKQPWEQEAWGRQAELAEKVCKELEVESGEA